MTRRKVKYHPRGFPVLRLSSIVFDPSLHKLEGSNLAGKSAKLTAPSQSHIFVFFSSLGSNFNFAAVQIEKKITKLPKKSKA